MLGGDLHNLVVWPTPNSTYRWSMLFKTSAERLRTAPVTTYEGQLTRGHRRLNQDDDL